MRTPPEPDPRDHERPDRETLIRRARQAENLDAYLDSLTVLHLACGHQATLFADRVRADQGQRDLWCETCKRWQRRVNR